MPSSTFSSDEQVVRAADVRPVVTTVIVLAFLLTGLETVTRIGFTRVSRIEARIHAEHAAATAVRPGGPAHPTILLLGNSLLLEGVDYGTLRQALEPHAMPVRFAIEQTTYLDWYYGIRRLFDDGAGPDRVVLCLNLPQLLATSLRGEYSAFYLIRTQDLASAGTDAGLDLTGTSGLYFARYSLFYAGRNNFRNFALNNVLPAYSGVLHSFTNTVSSRVYGDAEILDTATSRLNQLRLLCAQYNARFDLLLPPSFGSGSRTLFEAGRRAGVSVLEPVPQNSWKSDVYKDDFHLNREGAARFTRLLAANLLQQQ
jgi:hypothetical protein